MARPPVGVPVSPWQPAGYLPAPKQARFISEAEQAAEKLPATIKPQSLKNALLKGGAKPLELEYAGIDDFVSQNQGKPVSAADVLAHLKTEGPLGKLKRVEQQVVDGQPKWDFDQKAVIPGSPEATPPDYADDIRQPFDTQRASNLTKYHDWTVAGRQGDFTGYREALIEDPKNNGGDFDRLAGPEWDGTYEQKPADAHHSDYWVRYAEHPDRIAVQNIQSDVGQKFSKFKTGTDEEMAGANRRLQDIQQHRKKVMAELNELNENPWSPESARNDLETALYGANDEIAEIVADNERRFMLSYGDDGEEFFSARLGPASPLSADDNWKNLMARHVALQSINGGGKPITIPTGQQMVEVEKFGGHSHNLNTAKGRLAATKGAEAYNSDLVRRLQKIFRGLHPDGATVTALELPEVGAKSDFISSLTPGEANDMDELFFQQQLRAVYEAIENRSILPAHADNRLRPPRYEDNGEGYGYEFDPLDAGLAASSDGDNKLYEAMGSWDPAYVERVLGENFGGISQELRDAAMQVISHNRLMQEMGDPGVVRSPQPPPATAPGWTIKPSPMAVRQALEKGLPIMSLAPLLLQPSQQENR